MLTYASETWTLAMRDRKGKGKCIEEFRLSI